MLVCKIRDLYYFCLFVRHGIYSMHGMLACCGSAVLNIAFRERNDKIVRTLGWKSGNLNSN